MWDYDKREARFVEVKGPGDSLSDTQKIWIDVLLSAGVPVEVCRVKAKEDDVRPAMRTKRTDSGRSKRSSVNSKSVELIVLDDGADEEETGDCEWLYESGDEGKPEGRWAQPGEVGKKVRR